MQSKPTRHKVFVSYHHANDQEWRNEFEKLFADIHDNIMVTKSVQIGEIDPNLKTETIRQKIRDKYLSDSTVTVVLIGAQTWQRKHVDWEIGSSIRKTENSSRSGLLGIILPTYPTYYPREHNSSIADRLYPKSPTTNYDQYTIPPRLYDNIKRKFAEIYKWNTDPKVVQRWIHEAYERRDKIDPDNSFENFVNNRSGDRWQK